MSKKDTRFRKQNLAKVMASYRNLSFDNSEENFFERAEELANEHLDYILDCSPFPECREDYMPEKYDKHISDDGAWIQVINPPIAEIKVPFLSIWFANPIFKNDNWKMIVKYENPYLIKIVTPKGEMRLYPHEYNLVEPDTFKEYLRSVDGEHISINWMDPRNEYFDIDRLFYIMSKGINKSDAYQMLLPEINSPNVCYLSFHQEYQKIFAGVGIPSLNARERIENYVENYSNYEGAF